MDEEYSEHPMNYTDHIQEVELRRRTYEAALAIDERQLDAVRQASVLEQRYDVERQQLLLHLRAEIYGIDHPKKLLVQYPKTWWDAVKERFAPEWFIRRYPISRVEITVHLEELYPEIKPLLPDRNPVMKYYIKKQTAQSGF